MSTISSEDFATDPDTVLKRVEAGERIIITRGGRTVAEVRPVPVTSPLLRPFGLAAGEFSVPNDFDSPLPDDILQGFEGR